MIANVMSAGRIHFDCVTTMNLLRTLLFIFITVFFVLLLPRTMCPQIHYSLQSLCS